MPTHFNRLHTPPNNLHVKWKEEEFQKIELDFNEMNNCNWLFDFILGIKVVLYAD